MKKKILSLIMSAVTLLTLSGCSNTKDDRTVANKEDIFNKAFRLLDNGVYDAFIVLKQNDIDILHKGHAQCDSYSTAAICVKFNCGEIVISNADYSISVKMPKESRYDEICEECFERE